MVVVVVAADDQNVAMMFLPLPVLFLPAFVVEDHNMAVMVSIPISIPVSVVISIADGLIVKATGRFGHGVIWRH